MKGVDLKAEQGSFAAIVGPSGAGKSTLLHILGGLDAPDGGSVLLDGRDIYSLPEAELCRVRNERLGFVFQFYHLLSEFSVFENVLMPALIGAKSGQGLEALKGQAAELLDKAGLSQRLAHFPAQLSGGERQRVAIIRALINRPGMLLCDEPTGNLDSKTGDEIISLIKEINRKERMTVVLVTHNQELARSADRIYHLKDGQLIS